MSHLQLRATDGHSFSCYLARPEGVARGGGIPQVVEPTPRCPLQFRFGEQDTHIPLREVAKIRDAFPQGEYHTCAAGHGFNCAERAGYDPAAAHLAFVRVKEFFGKHLG